MALADRRAHDAAMAAYMKDRPGSFPDSIRRPHQGEGSGMRKLAMQMGRVPNVNSHFQRGMLGGVLCARLGLGDFGVKEFV